LQAPELEQPKELQVPPVTRQIWRSAKAGVVDAIQERTTHFKKA
jgi:hypothetical protein